MTFSVKQIRERYGVSEHTVLRWIRNGELAAINVARRSGGKPKWRITEEAVMAFELLRTAAPTEPRTRRRTNREDVIKFY